MRLSVRDKILVIATAVILCTIGAVVATSTTLSKHEYEAALQSRSLAIAKSLTIQLERLLQLGIEVHDIVGFEEQCQEVVRSYSGIDVALVADHNGNVLFHSSSAAASLDGALRAAVVNRTEGVITQEVGGLLWHNATAPAITPQNQHVASVIVAFHGKIVADKLARTLWVNIGVGLAALLTGLIILYASLARFVSRPLTDLLSTVVKLRQSPLDLTRRAPVQTADEIGQLGTAFNQLMEELQNTTVSKVELETAMGELKRLSSVLVEQKEQVEVTLHSIGDAVISVDNKANVQYLNPKAEHLCGWPLKEAEGLPLQNVLHLFNSTTNAPLPNPFEPAFFKGETISSNLDAELLRRDGAAIGVDYTAAPMHSPNGDVNGGVLTLRDVSNERNMAQRLSWEASHDALTGLFNRREFTDRLEISLEKTQPDDIQHVVFFMDLDRFKNVNDSAGHAAGDQLLKGLSTILSEKVRPTDTLARLGGDEFALLLENCPMIQAQRIAATLLTAVEAYRFEYDSQLFTVGVSIGLAIVDGTVSCAEVLTRADTACYMAKEQGRNRVCTYQSSANNPTEKKRQADWITKINTALEEDQFVLYHQSYLALKKDSSNREYIEVLLRLRDTNGSLIQPSSFMPPAERYKLMASVDRWVIKKVFSLYHKLVQQRLGAPLTCAINVSESALNTRDLIEFIRSQVLAHALPEHAICFEVTEATAVNNLARTAEFIQSCKTSGFLFALDDFGTGASSFNYLKTLPVDFIKIDGSFVKNIVQDPVNKTMAETINRIGHIMDIKTIAEYAESPAIIEVLRELEVDYAQGLGVHIPAPLVT